MRSVRAVDIVPIGATSPMLPQPLVTNLRDYYRMNITPNPKFRKGLKIGQILFGILNFGMTVLFLGR